MSDNSGAMPLTAPLLEKQYRAVESFQEKRARSARLISKGAIGVAGILLAANLGLAWAVAAMLPLTKLVPVVLLVRADGSIDTSATLSTLPKTANEAVIRAALWQYVVMREGYTADTAQYRWDIVSGMSDVATRTTYQEWFQYKNPMSPQTVLGKNGTVTVEPISVALIGPHVAQVRYKRELTIGTNQPLETTWTATVEFEQVDTLPAAQRLTDPAGLIVTSYQIEQDSAP